MRVQVVSDTGMAGNRLRHRGQRHDESGIDEPLEVRRERLGEGPVADEETSLYVAFQRLRGEVGRGHEYLLVVVDDGLGMEDGPGGVARVDG